jgi:hypothetical protein
MAGCGGPTRPATVPVAGHVTYRGKSVPMGEIMFYPEQGHPATGTIGADGAYRLMTYAPGDGAIPGRYRVTIRAVRFTGGGHAKTFDEELRGGGSSAPAKAEWLVPEEYSRPETTPLRVDVTPGSKVINFDLPPQR